MSLQGVRVHSHLETLTKQTLGQPRTFIALDAVRADLPSDSSLGGFREL